MVLSEIVLLASVCKVALGIGGVPEADSCLLYEEIPIPVMEGGITACKNRGPILFLQWVNTNKPKEWLDNHQLRSWKCKKEGEHSA